MNNLEGHKFDGVLYPVRKGHWAVFPELCKGCGLCIEKCPTKAIIWSTGPGAYGTPRVALKPEECKSCGICSTYCPDAAISLSQREKT